METESNTLAWPPAFSLKKHPRAKYVRFRASAARGLELIVPTRFNVRHIPEILEKNREWIEKILKQMPIQQATDDHLPPQLELKALEQIWSLQYLASPTRLRLRVSGPQELVLIGNIEDKKTCKKKLLQWLKLQAKLHLLPQLQQVSRELGLAYQSATIRSQTTRWGSCSRKKTINLNYKLLFLPPALVRHVMIHELCHTVHFNHSDKFWLLVSQFDSQWREHRRSLRKTNTAISI